MATFYSSFFSSGLLAPDAQSLRDRTPQPPSPSTPRQSLRALPVEEDDIFHFEYDAPPMASLRRRRSSLTVAASPVAVYKSSSSSNALRAAHRQARLRSGSNASTSDTSTASISPPTFVGRLRSGSLGTALRYAPPGPAAPCRAYHTASSPRPPLPLLDNCSFLSPGAEDAALPSSPGYPCGDSSVVMLVDDATDAEEDEPMKEN
ncbi:hypothetical protein A0H81_06527 [Grifola frondosa]|uniref:Uncharacterized protein n=1 Tax=Grifola frondosa TaxID=5627 RepID=A0A1C7MEY4_GRIFR|nr:hypothetical protein A0H81_06527 [Grifola frondosa]